MPLRRRHTGASLIEGLLKRHDWHSAALVGISDYVVLSRLLGTATRVQVTVVGTNQIVAHRRDTGLWARISRLCASYASRATLIEATPLNGLEKIGPDVQYDLVYLANCDAETLAAVARGWLPKVKHDGILVGDGTRDLRVRGILKAIAPHCNLLRDGYWSATVRGTVVPGVVEESDRDKVAATATTGHGDSSSGKEATVSPPAAPAKRSRGRPPGARNRPKVTDVRSADHHPRG